MLTKLGFDTYDAACNMRAKTLADTIVDDVHLYTFNNLVPLLLSGILIIFRIFGPYILPVIIFSLMITYNSILFYLNVLVVILVALDHLRGWLYFPYSPLNHGKGSNYYGNTTKLGVHVSSKSTLLKAVLHQCPNITNPSIKKGALALYQYSDGSCSELRPTPWVFSGDMRTLLPFLLFHAKPYKYERRWIRVPIAAGPLSNQTEGLKSENSDFEAVALDCAVVSRSVRLALGGAADGVNYNNDREPEYVFLVLAGLTGGSSEGYILDFVNAATSKGHDCFVMLGRGLGKTPCESDALFHGARTSDLAASASILRQLLPKSIKIFAVGVSMGGIIITNAAARGVIPGISGAVSLGGCFDCDQNSNYYYSKTVWQPMLTFGLKQAFAATEKNLNLLTKKFGQNAKTVIGKLASIVDFDSVVVTGLHGFSDVHHYYADMCGASKKVLADTPKFRFSVPLLAVHAADDPIIHSDTQFMTQKRDGCEPGLIQNIENLVCVVTETGGHVGWPLGLKPWEHRWAFQNTIALEFCRALSTELDKLH